MKFVLKEPFKENIYTLIRRAGYHFQGEDKEKSKMIFVRPARGYPRFHLYCIRKALARSSASRNANAPMRMEMLIFNLHLDQKKPIYKGAPAHAGEYEGEAVEKEIKRIKEILLK